MVTDHPEKVQDKYELPRKPFTRLLVRKLVKTMGYAALLRFTLKLLFNRLRLLKSLKEPVPIVQFAVGSGAFSLIFHMVRRLFALNRPGKKWLSQELEVILSCALASLGLLVMDEGDLRIVKVVVYSRAMAAGCHLLGELTGLYRPVENSDDSRRFTVESALALMASTFCCYAFVYEVKSMPTSFVNSFNRGASMSQDEKALFDSMRAIREIELRLRSNP